jgi:LEA14-like dessication related protein
MHRITSPAAVLAALASAALLAGCAGLNQLAQGGFQRPTLRFQGVAVASLDFDGATLAFDYRLVNRNGFGLTLERVRYGLALEGREVTRGEVAGGLHVPAAGEAPVRFTARLPFAEVPRILELVERGAPVAYTVAGAIGVSTPIGVVELPVQHSGTVDLPGLPAFRLAGVEVRLAGLTDVEVDVHLSIHNPNPFPLPAGQLGYALSLDGQPVATAQARDLQPVPAGGEARLTIPVRVSLLGAGRAVAPAVRGGGAEVRVTGRAKLGAVPVPLDVAGKSRRP